MQMQILVKQIQASSQPKPAPLEIPITIDSLQWNVDPQDDAAKTNYPSSSEPPLSRCIFFSVSTEDPIPGWEFILGNQRVPFVLLGMLGILYQPLSGTPEFQSANDLDALIQAIEATPGDFAVETDMLWIPTEWLERVRRSNTEAAKPSRGEVYRIHIDLFRHLWRANMQRVRWDDTPFLKEIVEPAMSPMLRFSSRETTVFAEWTERQFALFGKPGSGSPP